MENEVERGGKSTETAAQFEPLFRQQLNCLHNSVNRVYTLLEQVEAVIVSPSFREFLQEYLDQLDTEKERSSHLLTSVGVKACFVRNDIIEGFALELRKTAHAKFENSSLRDAAYCLQLNMLIQYLISFYKGLKEIALVLQLPAAVKILEEGFYGESDYQLMLNCLVSQKVNQPHHSEKTNTLYESTN